eukprot:2860528-Rhodomonas_salina.1
MSGTEIAYARRALLGFLRSRLPGPSPHPLVLSPHLFSPIEASLFLAAIGGPVSQSAALPHPLCALRDPS